MLKREFEHEVLVGSRSLRLFIVQSAVLLGSPYDPVSAVCLCTLGHGENKHAQTSTGEKTKKKKTFAVWWLNDVGVNPQMHWIPFYITSCSPHCEHVRACKHFLPYSVGSPSCCCVHVVIQKCILTAIQSEILIEYWLQSIFSPRSLTQIVKRSERRLAANMTEYTLYIQTEMAVFFSLFLPGRGKWWRLYWETTLRLCCPFYLSLVFKGWVAISQWWSHAELYIRGPVGSCICSSSPYTDPFQISIWSTEDGTQSYLALRQIKILTEPLCWIWSHSTAERVNVPLQYVDVKTCNSILYNFVGFNTHPRLHWLEGIFVALRDLFSDFWYEHRTRRTLGLNIAFVIYVWSDFTCTPLRQNAGVSRNSWLVFFVFF